MREWIHILVNAFLAVVGSIIALLLLCLLYLKIDEVYDIAYGTKKIYASGQQIENHCHADISVVKRPKHDCA